MKRLFLLAFITIFGLGLTYLIGCNSRATNSDANADTTDPGFQMVQSVANEGLVGYDAAYLKTALFLIDSIPGNEAPARLGKLANGDIDSLVIETYELSNYWHIFSFRASLTSGTDSMVLFGYDSIRFSEGDNYVTQPDTNITGMNIRIHLGAAIGGPGYAFLFHNHSGWNLAGKYKYYFTLSGLSSDTLAFHIENGDEASCDFDFTANQLFQNLYFDTTILRNGECPSSGNMAMAATLGLSCTGGEEGLDSLDINGSWNMNLAFDDGRVTGTFRHDDKRWVVTRDCEPEPALVPSSAKLIKKIRR